MKFKIGDYIKITYLDGVCIGIISPLTKFLKTGRIERLWIYPLYCNSNEWGWVNSYIGARYRNGKLAEVNQYTATTNKISKIELLNKEDCLDTIMLEEL